MRIGPVRLSAVSVALLVLQLAIVSAIAAKYLYERATRPRVWTRSAVYDPELVMRGLFRQVPQSQWKEFVQGMISRMGFGGETGQPEVSAVEKTGEPGGRTRVSAAGVTPSIRAAWPRVAGRIADSFCRISFESPTIAP